MKKVLLRQIAEEKAMGDVYDFDAQYEVTKPISDMSKTKCSRRARSAVARRVPLEEISQECRELKEAIQATCLDTSFTDHYWRIDKIELIKNDRLQKNYDAYKKEQAYTSRNSDRLKDMFVFSAETEKACDEICHEGHRVGTKKRHVLGYTGSGVHLVRNYDILTRYMTYQQYSAPASIVVYKACLGKVKHVVPRLFKDDRFVNPCCGFTCHVSARPIKTTMPICEAINCSYAYFYEFDDISSNTVKYPRQILPYAILHLERKSPVTVETPFLAVASGNALHGMEVKGETRRGFRFIFTKPVPRCKRPNRYGGKSKGELKSKQHSKSNDLKAIKEQLKEMRTRSSKVSRTMAPSLTKYEFGSRLLRRCSETFYQKRKPHVIQRLRGRDATVDYSEVCDGEDTVSNKVKKQNCSGVLASALNKPSSSKKLLEEAKGCFKETCLSTFDVTNYTRLQGSEESTKLGNVHFAGSKLCTIPLSFNPIVILKRLHSSVHKKKFVIIGTKSDKRPFDTPSLTENPQGTYHDVYEFTEGSESNAKNTESIINPLKETKVEKADKPKYNENQSDDNSTLQSKGNSSNTVTMGTHVQETKTKDITIKPTVNIHGDLKIKISLTKANETNDAMDVNTIGDEIHKGETPHCKENKTQQKLNDLISNPDPLKSENTVTLSSGKRVPQKMKQKVHLEDGSEAKNVQTGPTSPSETLTDKQDKDKHRYSVDLANDHRCDYKERLPTESLKSKHIPKNLNHDDDINKQYEPGGNANDDTSVTTTDIAKHKSTIGSTKTGLTSHSETLTVEQDMNKKENKFDLANGLRCNDKERPPTKNEQSPTNLNRDNDDIRKQLGTGGNTNAEASVTTRDIEKHKSTIGSTDIGESHSQKKIKCNSSDFKGKESKKDEKLKYGISKCIPELNMTKEIDVCAKKHTAKTNISDLDGHGKASENSTSANLKKDSQDTSLTKRNTPIVSSGHRHVSKISKHVACQASRPIEGNASTGNDEHVSQSYETMLKVNTLVLPSILKHSESHKSHQPKTKIDGEVIMSNISPSVKTSSYYENTSSTTKLVGTREEKQSNVTKVQSIDSNKQHSANDLANHSTGISMTGIPKESPLMSKNGPNRESKHNVPLCGTQSHPVEREISSQGCETHTARKGITNSIKDKSGIVEKSDETISLSNSKPPRINVSDRDVVHTSHDQKKVCEQKTSKKSDITGSKSTSTQLVTGLTSTVTVNEQKTVQNVLQSSASTPSIVITCSSSRSKSIACDSGQCLHPRTVSVMSKNYEPIVYASQHAKYIPGQSPECRSDLGNTVNHTGRDSQDRYKNKSSASANFRGTVHSGNNKQSPNSNKPDNAIPHELTKIKHDIPTTCQNDILRSDSSVMSDSSSKLCIGLNDVQGKGSCESLTGNGLEVSNNDNLPKLDEIIDFQNFTNASSDKNNDTLPKLIKMKTDAQTPNLKRKRSSNKTMDANACKRKRVVSTTKRTSVSNAQTDQHGHKAIDAKNTKKNAFLTKLSPGTTVHENIETNTVFATHGDQTANTSANLLKGKQLHPPTQNSSAEILHTKVSIRQLKPPPSSKYLHQPNSGFCMNAEQHNRQNASTENCIVETSSKASSPALALAAPALLNCAPAVASAQTAHTDAKTSASKIIPSNNTEKNRMSSQPSNAHFNPTHNVSVSRPTMVCKNLEIVQSRFPKPNTDKLNSTVVAMPHVSSNPISCKSFAEVPTSLTELIRPVYGSSISPGKAKLSPPISNLVNYRHNSPSKPSRRHLLLDSDNYSTRITQPMSVQQVMQPSPIYKLSPPSKQQLCNVDVAQSSLVPPALMSKDKSQPNILSSETVSSINNSSSCTHSSPQQSCSNVVHSATIPHLTESPLLPSSSSTTTTTDTITIPKTTSLPSSTTTTTATITIPKTTLRSSTTTTTTISTPKTTSPTLSTSPLSVPSSIAFASTHAKTLIENKDLMHKDSFEKQNDDIGKPVVEQDMPCTKNKNVPSTTTLGTIPSQIDVETVKTVKSSFQHFLRDNGSSIRQNLSKQNVTVSTQNCSEQDTKACPASTTQSTSANNSIANMLIDTESTTKVNGSQRKCANELGNTNLMLSADKASGINEACEPPNINPNSTEVPTHVKISPFKEYTDTDSNDTVIGGILNHPLELEEQPIDDQIITYEYTLEHLSELEYTGSTFASNDTVIVSHTDTQTTKAAKELNTKTSGENHPIKPRLSIFDTLSSSIMSTEHTLSTSMDKGISTKADLDENSSNTISTAEPLKVKQEPRLVKTEPSSEIPANVSTEALVEDTIHKAENKPTSALETGTLTKREIKPLSFFSKLTERKRAVAEPLPKSKEQCKSAIVQTLQELSEVLNFLNGNKKGDPNLETIENSSVQSDALAAEPEATPQSHDSSTIEHQRKSSHAKMSIKPDGKVYESQTVDPDVEREQSSSNQDYSRHTIDLLNQPNCSFDKTDGNENELDIAHGSGYVHETTHNSPSKTISMAKAKPETPKTSEAKQLKQSHDHIPVDSNDTLGKEARDLDLKCEHINSMDIVHSNKRAGLMSQNDHLSGNAQETNHTESIIRIRHIKTEPTDPLVPLDSTDTLSHSRSSDFVDTASTDIPTKASPETPKLEHQNKLDMPNANARNIASVETPGISNSKTKDSEYNPAELSNTLEVKGSKEKSIPANRIDRGKAVQLRSNTAIEKEADELPKLFDYENGPDIACLETFGVSETAKKKEKLFKFNTKTKDNVRTVANDKHGPGRIDIDANNATTNRKMIYIAESFIPTHMFQTAIPISTTLNLNDKQTEDHRSSKLFQNCKSELSQSQDLHNSHTRSEVLPTVRNARQQQKDSTVKFHPQRELSVQKCAIWASRKAGALNKGMRERKNMFDVKVNSKPKSLGSWKNFTSTKSVHEFKAANYFSSQSNWVHNSPTTDPVQEYNLKGGNHIDTNLKSTAVHKSTTSDSVQESKLVNPVDNSLHSTLVPQPINTDSTQKSKAAFHVDSLQSTLSPKLDAADSEHESKKANHVDNGLVPTSVYKSTTGDIVLGPEVENHDNISRFNLGHKSTAFDSRHESNIPSEVIDSLHSSLTHKLWTDSVQESKLSNQPAANLLSADPNISPEFEGAHHVAHSAQSRLDHDNSPYNVLSGLANLKSQNDCNEHEVSKTETQPPSSDCIAEVVPGVSAAEMDFPLHSSRESVVSHSAHADSTTVHVYTQDDKSTIERTENALFPINDSSENANCPRNDTVQKVNLEIEMTDIESKPSVTSSSNFDMHPANSEEKGVSKNDCKKKTDRRKLEKSKKRKSHKKQKHDIIPYDVVMRKKIEQHRRFQRGETPRKFIDYDNFKAELRRNQKDTKKSKTTKFKQIQSKTTEADGNMPGAAKLISARGTELYEDFDSDEGRMPDTGNELSNKRKLSGSQGEGDDSIKFRRSDRSDSGRKSESSRGSRSRSKSKPSDSPHSRSNSQNKKRGVLPYHETSPTVPQNRFDAKFKRRFTPMRNMDDIEAENQQRSYRSRSISRGPVAFKRSGTGYFQWRRKYGQTGEPYTITRKGRAQTFEEFVEWKGFKEREKIRSQIEVAIREYRETFGRTDKAKDKKVASYLEFLTQSMQKDSSEDNARQRDYPPVKMEIPAQNPFTQFPKPYKRKTKPNPQVRARNKLRGIVNSMMQLQDEYSKSNQSSALISALKLENPSAPMGNSLIETMFREHMQQHFESISQRFKEELTGQLMSGMQLPADSSLSSSNIAIGNNLRLNSNDPLRNVLPHISETFDCQIPMSHSQMDTHIPDDDECFNQRNTQTHITEVTRDRTRSRIEDSMIKLASSSAHNHLEGTGSSGTSMLNVLRHSDFDDLNTRNNQAPIKDSFTRGEVASHEYVDSSHTSFETNMYKAVSNENNMAKPSTSGARRTLLETPKNITPRGSCYRSQWDSANTNDIAETYDGPLQEPIDHAVSQINEDTDRGNTAWSSNNGAPKYRDYRRHKNSAHGTSYKDNPRRSEYVYDAYEFSNYSRSERQRERQYRSHAYPVGHYDHRDRLENRARNPREYPKHNIHEERPESNFQSSRKRSPASKHRYSSSDSRHGKVMRQNESKHRR